MREDVWGIVGVPFSWHVQEERRGLCASCGDEMFACASLHWHHPSRGLNHWAQSEREGRTRERETRKV